MTTYRPTLYTVLLLTLVATSSASGLPAPDRPLPPIGKRTYLLEGGAPGSPVRIERADGAKPGAKVLRDPVHPGGPVRVEVPKIQPKPVPQARASRAGRLRFGKLKVSGQLLRPRVEFSQDIMPLDRADEPLAQPFLDKVFAPARDESF